MSRAIPEGVEDDDDVQDDEDDADSEDAEDGGCTVDGTTRGPVGRDR